MNVVILSGRVGQPLTRKGNVGEFTLATTEREKNEKGKYVNVPEWHTIKVFGEQNCNAAEEYFTKGACLNIQGRIKTERWTKDGQAHSMTKIYMHSWEFAPSTGRKGEEKA